jgi:hypothetical protein
MYWGGIASEDRIPRSRSRIARETLGAPRLTDTREQQATATTISTTAERRIRVNAQTNRTKSRSGTTLNRTSVRVRDKRVEGVRLC